MYSIQGERILFAHYLRGIAALIVVIAHLLGAFWEFSDSMTAAVNVPTFHINSPFVVKLLLFKFSCLYYGRFGVALFFLISGFVIPFSLKNYAAKQFLTARFFRLWPTYWLCTAISIGALLIGAQYFHRPYHLQMQQILAHVLIMPSLFWQKPIDAVVWTLEIEIEFYLLCACIRPWINEFKVNRIFLFVIVCFSVFITTLLLNKPIYSQKFSAYFLYLTSILQTNLNMLTYMLIGTVFYFLHQKKISLQKGYTAITMMFGIFTYEWVKAHPAEKYRFFAFFLALTVFSLCAHYGNKLRVPKIFNYFAKISYPLYVVHCVVGYVFMRISINIYPSANLAIVVALLLSFTLASLVHVLIEAPSNNLGKKIARKLSARNKTSEVISLLNQQTLN